MPTGSVNSNHPNTESRQGQYIQGLNILDNVGLFAKVS